MTDQRMEDENLILLMLGAIMPQLRVYMRLMTLRDISKVMITVRISENWYDSFVADLLKADYDILKQGEGTLMFVNSLVQENVKISIPIFFTKVRDSSLPDDGVFDFHIDAPKGTRAMSIVEMMNN